MEGGSTVPLFDQQVGVALAAPDPESITTESLVTRLRGIEAGSSPHWSSPRRTPPTQGTMIAERGSSSRKPSSSSRVAPGSSRPNARSGSRSITCSDDEGEEEPGGPRWPAHQGRPRQRPQPRSCRRCQRRRTASNSFIPQYSNRCSDEPSAERGCTTSNHRN